MTLELLRMIHRAPTSFSLSRARILLKRMARIRLCPCHELQKKLQCYCTMTAASRSSAVFLTSFLPPVLFVCMKVGCVCLSAATCTMLACVSGEIKENELQYETRQQMPTTTIPRDTAPEAVGTGTFAMKSQTPILHLKPRKPFPGMMLHLQAPA